MILLQTKSGDQASNQFIRWLKTSCIRINCDQTILEKVTWDSKRDNVSFKVEDVTKPISLKDISFYFRRGGKLSFKIENSVFDGEFKAQEEFLKHNLNKKTNLLGRHLSTNKLLNLLIASKIGFIIPDTFLSISPKFYINYFKKKNYYYFSSGTVKYDYNNNNHELIHSLIQKEIDKKFEVRTLAFKNKTFSMAIFSQQNTKTKLDYRNYPKIPNRYIPFKLPDNIENKLFKFMYLTGLDFGSFDFIVNLNSDFVFLEVNPVGQFDWLNRRCNYYIYKAIIESYIK